MAQTQLRTVWGMELRELPVREKMTLHEKRQGTLAVAKAWVYQYFPELWGLIVNEWQP